MTPNISGSVVTNAEVVWYTGGVSTTPRSLSATQETKKTLLPTVSCVGLWTSDSTKLLYGEIFTLEAERDVSVFTSYLGWECQYGLANSVDLCAHTGSWQPAQVMLENSHDPMVSFHVGMISAPGGKNGTLSCRMLLDGNTVYQGRYRLKPTPTFTGNVNPPAFNSNARLKFSDECVLVTQPNDFFVYPTKAVSDSEQVLFDNDAATSLSLAPKGRTFIITNPISTVVIESVRLFFMPFRQVSPCSLGPDCLPVYPLIIRLLQGRTSVAEIQFDHGGHKLEWHLQLDTRVTTIDTIEIERLDTYNSNLLIYEVQFMTACPEQTYVHGDMNKCEPKVQTSRMKAFGMNHISWTTWNGTTIGSISHNNVILESHLDSDTLKKNRIQTPEIGVYCVTMYAKAGYNDSSALLAFLSHASGVDILSGHLSFRCIPSHHPVPDQWENCSVELNWPDATTWTSSEVVDELSFSNWIWAESGLSGGPMHCRFDHREGVFLAGHDDLVKGIYYVETGQESVVDYTSQLHFDHILSGNSWSYDANFQLVGDQSEKTQSDVITESLLVFKSDIFTSDVEEVTFDRPIPLPAEIIVEFTREDSGCIPARVIATFSNSSNFVFTKQRSWYANARNTKRLEWSFIPDNGFVIPNDASKPLMLKSLRFISLVAGRTGFRDFSLSIFNSHHRVTRLDAFPTAGCAIRDLAAIAPGSPIPLCEPYSRMTHLPFYTVFLSSYENSTGSSVAFNGNIFDKANSSTEADPYWEVFFEEGLTGIIRIVAQFSTDTMVSIDMYEDGDDTGTHISLSEIGVKDGSGLDIIFPHPLPKIKRIKIRVDRRQARLGFQEVSFYLACNSNQVAGTIGCVDAINECLVNNPCSWSCQDLPEGFQCVCDFDQEIDINDGTTCVAKDFCRGVTCDAPKTHCVSQALISRYEYICTCPPGRFYNETSETCDWGECEPTLGDKRLSPCRNGLCVWDGQEISCECDKGFRLYNGNACTDIDECQEGTHDCKSSKCVNTFGGYYCECNSSFLGPQNECYTYLFALYSRNLVNITLDGRVHVPQNLDFVQYRDKDAIRNILWFYTNSSSISFVTKAHEDTIGAYMAVYTYSGNELISRDLSNPSVVQCLDDQGNSGPLIQWVSNYTLFGYNLLGLPWDTQSQWRFMSPTNTGLKYQKSSYMKCTVATNLQTATPCRPPFQFLVGSTCHHAHYIDFTREEGLYLYPSTLFNGEIDDAGTLATDPIKTLLSRPVSQPVLISVQLNDYFYFPTPQNYTLKVSYGTNGNGGSATYNSVATGREIHYAVSNTKNLPVFGLEFQPLLVGNNLEKVRVKEIQIFEACSPGTTFDVWTMECTSSLPLYFNSCPNGFMVDGICQDQVTTCGNIDLPNVSADFHAIGGVVSLLKIGPKRIVPLQIPEISQDLQQNAIRKFVAKGQGHCMSFQFTKMSAVNTAYMWASAYVVDGMGPHGRTFPSNDTWYCTTTFIPDWEECDFEMDMTIWKSYVFAPMKGGAFGPGSSLAFSGLGNVEYFCRVSFASCEYEPCQERCVVDPNCGPSCACDTGTQNDTYTCDIGACIDDNKCSQICNWRNNAVECSCLNETSWRAEGAQCYDVDECANATTSAVCAGGCNNTYGYFECTCGGLYIKDPDSQGGCLPQCGAKETGVCSQLCVNLTVSPGFRCECGDFHFLDKDGITCRLYILLGQTYALPTDGILGVTIYEDYAAVIQDKLITVYQSKPPNRVWEEIQKIPSPRYCKSVKIRGDIMVLALRQTLTDDLDNPLIIVYKLLSGKWVERKKFTGMDFSNTKLMNSTRSGFHATSVSLDFYEDDILVFTAQNPVASENNGGVVIRDFLGTTTIYDLDSITKTDLNLPPNLSEVSVTSKYFVVTYGVIVFVYKYDLDDTSVPRLLCYAGVDAQGCTQPPPTVNLVTFATSVAILRMETDTDDLPDRLLIVAGGPARFNDGNVRTHLLTPGTDEWVTPADLSAPQNSIGSLFGDPVGLSNSSGTIVGAFASVGWENRGAVYTYAWNTTSLNWDFLYRFQDANPVTGDTFGRNVSLAGQYAMISSPQAGVFMTKLTCAPGYLPPDCLDINECSYDFLSHCDLVNGYCQNLPGSYECLCTDPFARPLLDDNGRPYCDLGPCADGGGCHQICVLLSEITYICECEDGYSFDGDICVDNDECANNTSCGENAICTNAPGGYLCTCPDGYASYESTSCIEIKPWLTNNTIEFSSPISSLLISQDEQRNPFGIEFVYSLFVMTRPTSSLKRQFELGTVFKFGVNSALLQEDDLILQTPTNMESQPGFGKSMSVSPLAFAISSTDMVDTWFKTFFDRWDYHMTIYNQFPQSRFGDTVVVTDNTLIVSMPNFNSSRGAVAIYTKNDKRMAWTLLNDMASITSPSALPGSRFGTILIKSTSTVSPNLLVVGERGRMYSLSISRSNYALIPIALPDGMDVTSAYEAEYGLSAAIASGLLIIGAPRDIVGGNVTGSAFIYTLETNPFGDASWVYRHKIVPSISPGSLFGSSISIDPTGSYIAIGAPGWSDNTGKVHIYRLDGLLVEEVRLIAKKDGQPGDQFGSLIAMTDNVLTSMSNGALFTSYFVCDTKGYQGWDCSEDLDECAEPQLSQCTQNCTNLHPAAGYFMCTCWAGSEIIEDDINLVTGKPYKCQDINECVDRDPPCSQRCINGNQTSTCECLDGFYLDPADNATCIRRQLPHGLIIGLTVGIILPLFLLLIFGIVFYIRRQHKTEFKYLPPEVRTHITNFYNNPKSWEEKGTPPFFQKLLSPGSTEHQKVIELFTNHLDGVDISVVDIYAVVNPVLLQNFISTLKIMEGRLSGQGNMFNNEKWRFLADADQRVVVFDAYKQKTQEYNWNRDENGVPVVAPIIPVVHGTTGDTALQICSTGFAALSTLDAGFYGKGIYFTTSAHYALPYYAQKKEPCVIISYVIPGNVYPVVEDHTRQDGSSLLGKPTVSGCQAQYVRTTKAGLIPPPDYKDVTYDELVITQESQILPSYLLFINVEKKNFHKVASEFDRSVIDTASKKKRGGRKKTVDSSFEYVDSSFELNEI
eukprot:TRINITY_DN5133_c0_g1_i1.p1 TRINITY_DN5133_c0_g1~~TRINITY_DN5133_c0_g1_i1.p1  ORF type:complete len:3090 (-),score=350.31 TRINITY_DN5133_c0_g1_i1:161-9301(-)